MPPIEKLTIAIFVISVVVSAALFGVWEDKATLYAPILTLIYLTVACWVARGRDQRSDQDILASDLRPLISGRIIPPGGMILLLFWLYSLALIPFSILAYEAKIASVGFGAYLATYWASAHILSRFSYRKTVWSIVFSTLIFIALYSLVQHKAAPNLMFGMERYTDYWKDGRLGGTYQCPNHIAHLFQMGLPFCLVFLFIPQFGWFWRICFAYALPLFLLLIYQTQSRAGILGSVAALGTTVLLMIWRKSRRAFYVGLLAAPLLGAGVLGGLWAGSSMFRTRMQPVVQFIEHVTSDEAIEEKLTDFRPQTWLDTITMIKNRPVFGFGPGNYALTYEDYRTRFRGFRIETVHAHNEYLELIAEYGLVGGLLILLALISLSISMLRLIRASPLHHALPAVALLGALAGTAVHGFFDFELHNFPNAMILALLSGGVAAPLLQSKVGQASSLSSSARSVIKWIFLIAVILSAIWTMQVMSSSWIRVWGDRFLKEHQMEQAERFYKTAERIDPQNWKAHFGLGQVYYYRRYYELDPDHKHEWALKERETYADAYRINFKKEEVAYALGRVELFLGNLERGLDYLREAANYKRFNDFYWRKLGIELRKAGLYDEALNAFNYARKLDSSNKTVHRNIEWLNQQSSEK